VERELALEFVRVTEAAAIQAARWMGKGDKNAADGAAVEAMRAAFNTVNIDGIVVIGEGEMDEAPMLYIGERVGAGGGDLVDIAVDPLEGTNLVAKGLPNSIAVMAIAERGTLLHAPDMYMDKIAVGPMAKGKIDITKPPRENVYNVAEALGRIPEEITVVILDRPRHEKIIQDVRTTGARVKLISDGDVSPAISAAIEGTGVHMLLGIGGAPEGVIAAAALKCLGGDMQGRLYPESDAEINRARSMGIADINRVMTLDDMVRTEDVMFAATAITDGDMLQGVSFFPGGARTRSIVMRSRTGTVRFVDAVHKLDRKPLFIRRC